MPSGHNGVRAVVDCNLIISGLLWSGPPSKLMDAVVAGRLGLVLSPEIYLELEEVLERPKFAARIAARKMTPASLLAAVSSVAETIVPVPITHPAKLRDPGDLHVLGCAVSAQADAIITGDKEVHLLDHLPVHQQAGGSQDAVSSPSAWSRSSSAIQWFGSLSSIFRASLR